MADIHVIFPEFGGIVPSNRSRRVLKREPVTWHIYCENTAIAKIRIVFTGCLAGLAAPNPVFVRVNAAAQAPFFATLGGPMFSADGEILWTTVFVLGEKKEFGECIISGSAPISPTGYYTYKYSIEALNAGGKVIEKLDPEIITDDPIP
jgi:hypothetical protein